MAANEERPSTPLWWSVLVLVAAVLAIFWVIGVVIGFLVGLIKIAVLVILSIAIVGYVLGRKADR